LALLVHLFVTAFVFPFIGTLFFAGFVISGDARFFVSDVGILFFILPILAGFAPFLGWVTFVPLGCLTFLFFCATATTHARGAGFWLVAWALIGAGKGAAYAFVTSRHGFEPVGGGYLGIKWVGFERAAGGFFWGSFLGAE
jgi:hypothetical protein